jgi:Integrase core domain
MSWAEFLRQQAANVLECDFLTVDTLFLKRFYVLFFIELASRRVCLAGVTTNPDGPWVTQQARNLLMQLEGEGVRPRFLVRDRDSKFTREFDEVFRSHGIRVSRLRSGRRRRERTPSAGSGACAASASTGSWSSAAATSIMSSSHTSGITTSIGRTARSTSGHRSARCRRHASNRSAR